MTESTFLANIHHAYAQTDGSYAFPNSREGDLLKTAKREIETHLSRIMKLEAACDQAAKDHRHACANLGTPQQVASADHEHWLRYALDLATGLRG